MGNRYPAVPTEHMEELVRIVRRLRKECPWDREQTHRSMRHSLIEETYEVVETLDKGDMAGLCDELGDLLLHIILHATIAEQQREFTLADVVGGINRKLIRRHPHVFGTRTIKSSEEVRHQWDRIKMQEGRTSVLEGIPKAMPSLQRAVKVQQRAAKVGFDWMDPEEVWSKIREELEELHEALQRGSRKKREEEFGDMLFSLVNYSRFLDVNPENALRGTIGKFVRRFRFIEAEIRKQGKDIHDFTLEEMDLLWNKAKGNDAARHRRRSTRRNAPSHR